MEGRGRKTQALLHFLASKKHLATPSEAFGRCLQPERVGWDLLSTGRQLLSGAGRRSAAQLHGIGLEETGILSLQLRIV